MYGKNSGNLFKRILVLVLSAFITIAYMPGAVYALEGANADGGDITSEDHVTQNTGNEQMETAGAEENAGARSDGERGSDEVMPTENIESTDPDEAGGSGDIPEGDEGDVVHGEDRGTALRSEGDEEYEGDEWEEYEEEPLFIDLNVFNNNVLINEPLEYEAYGEGYHLHAILIYKDYKEGEQNEPDIVNEDYYSLDAERQPITYDEEGTFVLRVEAVTYRDGEIVDRVGNQETVTVTKEGETGSFSISKVNGSSTFSSGVEVTRCSDVEVECEKAALSNDDWAGHYWVDVNHYDPEAEGGMGEWAGHFADSDNNEMVFNTIGLQAGEYVVSACANSPGYTGSRSDNTFRLTVTEPDFAEGEMYVNVSNTDPVIGERIEISAYCPGAEEIRIHTDYNGSEDDWLFSDGRDWLSRGFSYYRAGTFNVVAVAGRYEEVNSSGGEDEDEDEYRWVETCRSEAITVTVTALAELSLNEPELPEYLVAGEDGIDFEVELPEHADWLQVYIEDESEWEELFSEETDSGNIHVEIPASRLRAGMLLSIEINASGYGCESVGMGKKIPVIGEAADEIRITASETNPLINEDVEFTVETGDLEVRQVTIYDGRGNFLDVDWDDYGTFTRWHRFDQQGTYTVFARVMLNTDDDEYWTYLTSAPITITSRKLGDISSFSISKVNGSREFLSGIEVARGDIVNIECSEAESADHYWVDAEVYEDEEEGYWRWYDHYADSDSRTLSLNTIGFRPGVYRISIGADAAGYEGSRSENEFTLTITEMNLPDGEVYFEISDDDLETCENFAFSAYYPEAAFIRVYMDYDRDTGWSREGNWSDYHQGNHNYRSSGTYKLVAVAYNDEWEAICESEPKTVTVTAPNGDLSLDLPELPAYYTAGQEPPSFSIATPDNAEGLRVNVQSEGDYWNNIYDKETRSGSLNVNIPADKLYEDSIIRVDVETWGRGYESTREEIRIPVIGETSDSLTLSADKTEAVVNENVEYELDTGSLNVSDIRFYNAFGGYDGSDWQSGNNSYYRSYNYNEPGTYTVYAKVEVERAGEYEWLTSEPVVVTVTSSGKAGSFSVTEVNGVPDPETVTVARGNLVNVTCSESQNADHYWIDVFRKSEWGSWEWYDSYADTNQPLLSFGTVNIEPGEYRLIVKANGTGYEECEADNVIGLTVTESDLPEDGIVFTVSKNELLTNEEFTYSVYGKNLGWVYVYMDYDKDRNWNRYHNNYDSTDRMSYGNSGTYKLVAEAYVYDAETDNYRKVMLSQEITVTAPYGNLSLNVPEMPAYLTAGEDTLNFEVATPANCLGDNRSWLEKWLP